MHWIRHPQTGLIPPRDTKMYKNRLGLEAWQIKEIKQALEEADAGEFSLAEDLAKAVKKYAS